MSTPGHPTARLILGAAHRRAGRRNAALRCSKRWRVGISAFRRRGISSSASRAPSHGRSAEAEAALRRAVQLNPVSADGWRLLADCLDAEAMPPAPMQARARYIKAATHDPRLREAAAALAENNLPTADALALRSSGGLSKGRGGTAHAGRGGGSPAPLRGRGRTARSAVLQLAPSFDAARHNYAVVLNRQCEARGGASARRSSCSPSEPQNPGYLNLKAAILANLGDYRGSIETYRGVSAVASRTSPRSG